MRKIRLLLVIFLALTAQCGPVFSESRDSFFSPRPMHYSGETTTLVIDTDMSKMRHDGPDNGHTSISLLSKNGAVLFQRKLDDNFKCLGYSRAQHAYVLQTVGETGISLKVEAFEYLPEDKPAIVYSKSFTPSFVAAMEAVVPSPDLRFIVFVGREELNKDYVCDTVYQESLIWRLYVLDTKSDTIRCLGKAPNPPPLSKWYLEEATDSFNPCDQWQWGFDGPMLEQNICQFISPNVLKVSYGRDTCRHRSKKRLIRRWTL